MCVCAQVLSPLSPSRVLAQVPVQVLDERVSMMTLGVQLVSGLSLSLQLNPAGAGTLGATAATRETITQLQQVTSDWQLPTSTVGAGCGAKQEEKLLRGSPPLQLSIT